MGRVHGKIGEANRIKYFACTSNYKFVEKFKLLSPISTKMPAGPDETDNHAPGAATEHTAKHASSKTETNASTHPLHAQPGPAVPKEFNVQQEGTKEERAAKTQELNKESKIRLLVGIFGLGTWRWPKW